MGYAKYLVSPFVDLGPSWAVIGSVCVGGGVMLVHTLVWALLHNVGAGSSKSTLTSMILMLLSLIVSMEVPKMTKAL